MRKLPRGIFQRGRSFYTRLRRGGGDRWISLGADREEAERKFYRIRAGDVEPGKRLIVAEAARRWVATVGARRSAKNARIAEKRVEKYLSEFFAYRPLDKVTREDLMAYRLWLDERGISPQTVAHVLSDARSFFRWAEEVGLIARAPVPRRLLPRIQERPPDRLTDEEVERVLVIREPVAFVVRFLLGTGLRWGEACRAQATDVERGMLVVSQTKSGKVRRVPLSAELEREIRGRVGRLVPYVYESHGSFARAVRRASGVERFHAHRLRHTFACRWLERGGSLVALQQILGHASVVTTQRYARLSDEIVRQEAERLVHAEGGR